MKQLFKSKLSRGDSTYGMAVAHIAYPLSGYVSEKCHWHDWARELVSLTNNGAQLALCGHSHKTDFAAAGTSWKYNFFELLSNIL